MKIKYHWPFKKKNDAICPLAFIKKKKSPLIFIVFFKSYNLRSTHCSVQMRLFFFLISFMQITAWVSVFKGLQRVIPEDQIIWWNIVLSHLFFMHGLIFSHPAKEISCAQLGQVRLIFNLFNNIQTVSIPLHNDVNSKRVGKEQDVRCCLTKYGL